MSEKIYIGRGKKVGQYGTIAVSICIDDIPEEHITKALVNGKRYLNLNISEKRDVDQYGFTHSVAVDTWKPDKDKAQPPAPAPAPRYGTTSETVQAQFDDDLPF
jgi:hypothetical protein